MTPPPTILHLEWRDLRGAQERRYRKPLRCAEQVVSILAAPDDVARLVGLWRTVGWDQDRLDWQPIDVAAFVEEAADAVEGDDHNPYEITTRERYRLVAAAWRHHQERNTTDAHQSH